MRGVFLALILILTLATPLKAAQTKEYPSLIITTLDGKNFDLKEKRGKVVIINFWAKWCIDCRKEMPILEEIYQKYKSQNLEIIGISIDRKRAREKVLEIASSLSYPNAMLYEVKETSFEEPNAIPVSYVIDKNGKLIAKITASDSEVTKEDFENILKPLLK